MVINKLRAITAIAEYTYSGNAAAIEELLTVLRNVVIEEHRTGASISTVEITEGTYKALFTDDALLAYSSKG